MKIIDTVLFDFDGTIMNTSNLVIQSWQHTFRTVEGRERPVEAIVKTLGEPLYTTMTRLLPQITPEEGVEIYRHFMRESGTELISPFPGMPELMRDLKSEGFKMGVVTSRLAETTHQWLELFHLKTYLDCIITCEDTDRHKPDPEPVKIALERLASESYRALMLGDTLFDILCARNAGVGSVLVGWQLAIAEEELRGANAPDYKIEAPSELKAILAGLNHD